MRVACPTSQGYVVKTEALTEYGDYLTLENGNDTYDKARELAFRCAGLYNGLMFNARHYGGTDPDGSFSKVHIPALTASLKFNLNGPWMSFSFKFAHIVEY